MKIGILGIQADKSARRLLLGECGQRSPNQSDERRNRERMDRHEKDLLAINKKRSCTDLLDMKKLKRDQSLITHRP